MYGTTFFFFYHAQKKGIIIIVIIPSLPRCSNDFFSCHGLDKGEIRGRLWGQGGGKVERGSPRTFITHERLEHVHKTRRFGLWHVSRAHGSRRSRWIIS